MRLRNVKGAKEIIESSNYYIIDPFSNLGKWSKVFGNNNPIYVEIGMGKGDFIIENAKMFPNINFIGIEKYDSVLVRAIQKIEEIDLPNLKLIRMNANKIDLVFDHEINKIYLNFSDPWPKERHEKRRLTSKYFLDKYKNLFEDNQFIEMKTDNIDLFNYSIESFKANGYEIDYLTNDLHKENIFNIMTEYEKKFSNLNIKINKLIASK